MTGPIRCLPLAILTLGCYASRTGDDAMPGDADAADARRDDGAGDVPAEADVPVDARDAEDAPPGCPPSSWTEARPVIGDPGGLSGVSFWVHGYAGPLASTCTEMDCYNDTCCNHCGVAFALRGERYSDAWASAIEVRWLLGSDPPACAGNECHMWCEPWGSGTEMYLHGSIIEDSRVGVVMGIDLPPCVLGASPLPGDYRFTLRSLRFDECASPPAGPTSGVSGDFTFRPAGAGEAAGNLVLDGVTLPGVPAELGGTFDGETVRLRDGRLCEEPCGCAFDVTATFPDTGSVVGTAYVAGESGDGACYCLAFVFEGRKVSDGPMPGG